MGYDVVSGLKFAVASFHDRGIQVWTAFYALALLASFLVAAALFVVLPALVVADVALLGMPVTTIAAVIFAALFSVAQLLVFLFFQYHFIRNALRLAGYPESGKSSFFQFVLVALKVFFVNITSWYDKRVLGLVLVLYAITALWMVAGFYVHPLMVSVGVGILAFAVMVHYAGVLLHSLRTIFAPVIYLKNGSDGPRAPSRSFALVKGQTADVFIPMLAGCVVFGMMGIPAYVLMPLLVGHVLLAAIYAGAALYLVHVYRHYDLKVAQPKK